MTKRCRHEFETKDGYPDDVICQKCGTIWYIPDYRKWTAHQLMHQAPPFIRRMVINGQAKEKEAENK